MKRQLIALMAAVLAAGQVRGEPPTWQAQGTWSLQSRTASCDLGRMYRAGTNSLSLWISAEPPGDGYRVLLVAPVGMFSGPTRDALLGFAGSFRTVGYLTREGRTQDGQQILALEVTNGKLSELLAAPQLDLQAAGEGVQLPLGGLADRIEPMRRCVTGLLERWGVDAIEAANPLPLANLRASGLITADDYPSEALRRGQHGSVTIIWRIGSAGRVTDCRVAQSSGFASLDQRSCDLVKERARYLPSSGAAWARRQMNWSMPGR